MKQTSIAFIEIFYFTNSTNTPKRLFFNHFLKEFGEIGDISQRLTAQFLEDNRL